MAEEEKEKPAPRKTASKAKKDDVDFGAYDMRHTQKPISDDPYDMNGLNEE